MVKVAAVLYVFLCLYLPVNITAETEAGSIDVHLIRSGSYSTIKCTSTKSILSNVSHTWMYHGKPGIDFNIGYSTFFIPNAEPSQSGVYTCVESGNNVSATSVQIKHEHRLRIYQMPEVVLQISQKYITPKCVKNYDKTINREYERLLCSGSLENCPYHVSHTCGVSIKRPSNGIVTINVEISGSNFIPPSSCINDVKCVRFKLVKYLDQLEKTPASAWNKLINNNRKLTKWYHHIKGSRSVTMLESCTEGFVPYKNQVCVPCEPGQFYKDGVCDSCPLNTYQDEGAAVEKCRPCPSDTTTNTIGATSLKACKTHHSATTRCVAGQFYDKGICIPCPINTYQEEVNNAEHCKQCPAGEVTESVGSTIVNACNVTHAKDKICQHGEFYKNGLCSKCPSNTYQDEVNSKENCKPCPSGTTTNSSGSTNPSACETNRFIEKRQENGENNINYVLRKHIWYIIPIGVVACIALLLTTVVLVYLVIPIVKRSKKVKKAKRYCKEFDERLPLYKKKSTINHL